MNGHWNFYGNNLAAREFWRKRNWAFGRPNHGHLNPRHPANWLPFAHGRLPLNTPKVKLP